MRLGSLGKAGLHPLGGIFSCLLIDFADYTIITDVAD
jgi:hypothetical protein